MGGSKVTKGAPHEVRKVALILEDRGQTEVPHMYIDTPRFSLLTLDSINSDYQLPLVPSPPI